MKPKGHGTVRGRAWMIDGRLANWSGILASAKTVDLPGWPDPDPPNKPKPAAVRVITEGEFQRLIKRAIRNDTYDLFQRRRKAT